jgi:sugar phosphate isomerase/epimerase
VSTLPDIAVSTSAYARVPLAAALRRIAELARAAEIRSFGAHTLLERDNVRAAAASGLPLSIHGPITREGLGSPHEPTRRAALELHRRHLAMAAELGATAYVVHPDSTPEPRPRDPAVVAALERSFVELLTVQEETGVPIVVENMPGAGCSHFTAPGDLDLRGLGLVLDVGHAAISGTLEAWLADPRAPLRHVHLHDNRGLGDSDDPHLPLGAGVVDFAAVMAAARAAGAAVVLELNTEADVVASLEYLRALGLIA